MEQLSRTRSALMIALLVFLWGISWPIYKIALNYSPPILFSGMRCLIGGLALFIYALPRIREIRFKQNWKIYLISGLLNSILFFALQTIGLRFLPSGLFSVIVYLQPVLVGIFAWIWLEEGMSGLKIFGLLLGFAGVGCISMEGFTGTISAAGILLALGSALSWALGTVYTKKIGNRVDSVWLAAVQFVFGGLVMTGISAGVENVSSVQWNNLTYLFSVLYGAIFGVAIAWLIYFLLVRSGDASKVASYTFITPLVAVLSGSIFLHEPFTPYLFVGIVLIVISIALVNRPANKSIKLTDHPIGTQV